MGVGVLYGKANLLEKMNPIMFGGEMMDTVDIECTVFKEHPYKFEAGTMMIPEVLGLGAAIDYINSIGLDKMHNYVLELKDYLIDKLKKIENIKIYNENTNSGIISFNIEGIHAHDIASMLDKKNIIVRAGYHCAQPLLDSLNIQASARISLAFYNTKEECDKLVEALMKASDYINELF
jgi:cysteine desulfurase/selenocysteine lyase